MAEKNKLVLYPLYVILRSTKKRRSAAVRMGRGDTARPPEAEWSSGVAAFSQRSYNQDIFKDPKKRHDHLGVLYNKDNKDICDASYIEFLEMRWH